MSKVELERRTVAISGSFRKHYAELCEAADAFEKLGWVVSSPARSEIVNPGEDFAVLETDRTRSHSDIENRHLIAVSKASVLYVVNPGGYVGLSTALEMGWAFKSNVPVFLQNPPNDSILSELFEICENPEALEQALSRSEVQASCLTASCSIPELQNYIAKVVEQRGFQDESAQDVLLLLVEEIGELANAIRKVSGLKVDVADVSKRPVADELADILIYTLDLANICHIDLITALIEKEAANEKRTWVRKHEPGRNTSS